MKRLLLLASVNVLGCGGADLPKAGGALSTGRIEGRVRLLGDTIPSPTRVENSTDPDTCGRAHTLEDIVISSGNRGIRYAIVSLVDVPAAAIPAFEPETIVLDNTECRFSPHAAVLTAGSTLEARNSDPILHTTHLYGPADVNISLPVQGARSARILDRPGLYLVKCDIHGWMQAILRVDDHPFHAVTDERGAFVIDDVPAGDYVLEVSHERLGQRTAGVIVEEGVTTSAVIEYSWNEE
jgi:hypothetical protein